MNMTHLEYVLIVLAPFTTVLLRLALYAGLVACVFGVARILRSVANWIDRQ